MKKINKIIIAVAIILLFVAAGCVEKGTAIQPSELYRCLQQSHLFEPKPITPVQTTVQPVTPVQTVSEEINQKALLESVVMGSVMTMPENWDADAENDGVVLYPDLQDANGETVKFDNIILPVVVMIYTIEYTSDYKRVNGRMIAGGNATIDSWKDGNFILGGGIRVPYESMDTYASDDDFGRVYVTITLPDGRTIEAKNDLMRIKPE